jgi:outer membrane protein assembly factor BamB
MSGQPSRSTVVLLFAILVAASALPLVDAGDSRHRRPPPSPSPTPTPTPAPAPLPVLVRTITAQSAGASAAFRSFNGTHTSLADFRGDGTLQLVAQNDDGSVYVLRPSTGALLATLTPGNAGCTQACYDFEGVAGPINSPAVTDVDRSGRLSIITANTAAVVARFVFNPVQSTSASFVFQKEWERRFNDYQSFTTMDASVVLGDLLGDGQLESILSMEEQGVFAVRPDGTTLWKVPISGGHASPTIGDLDGDGRPEVVVANDDGKVYALDGRTGAQKWVVDTSVYVQPASIPAAPLVADINGDGRPDVAVVARDAHDATTFSNDHIMLFVFSNAGQLLWRAQPTWAAPLSHTRLVLVNVNGQRALLGGDWNTIGHKPGNFERVGPGHVFLYSATGQELWHQTLDLAWSDDDFVVADVVGDAAQEVLAGCTQNARPGLCAFDLASGVNRAFIDTSPWTPTRPAIVGDVLGTGRLSFVTPVNQGTTGALLVHRADRLLVSAFPGWGALTIPHGEPTAGAPPLPTMRATFTPSGNNWWVQTMIDADRPLSGVGASVDGGAETALALQSYGGWAKSFYVANGSKVTFIAHATDGSSATSAAFLWPPGATPQPQPGPFNATFRPCCGNEWWIQVSVSANEPLAGVDVKIGAGTWTAMDKQTYGWTKSLHAPAGTQVTFRANSVNGGSVTSAVYVWPQ